MARAVLGLADSQLVRAIERGYLPRPRLHPTDLGCEQRFYAQSEIANYIERQMRRAGAPGEEHMNTFHEQLDVSDRLSCLEGEDFARKNHHVALSFLMALRLCRNDKDLANKVVAVVYRRARDGWDYLTVFVETVLTVREKWSIEYRAKHILPGENPLDSPGGIPRSFDPFAMHRKVVAVLVDSEDYATGEPVRDPGLLRMLATIHRQCADILDEQLVSQCKRIVILEARAAEYEKDALTKKTRNGGAT